LLLNEVIIEKLIIISSNTLFNKEIVFKTYLIYLNTILLIKEVLLEIGIFYSLKSEVA
jgi:hypothetical protein